MVKRFILHNWTVRPCLTQEISNTELDVSTAAAPPIIMYHIFVLLQEATNTDSLNMFYLI